MTKILVFALLLPLLFMNFGMSLSRAFARRLGTLTSRWVPESEVATPQVEALRLRLERLLKLAKFAVGAVGLLLGMYALVSGEQGFGIGSLALVVLLAVAFRNGADLSRTVIYARHDAAIIRARRGEVPAGRLLGPILALSVSGNALFLGLWAVLYYVLQEGTKLAAGVSVNRWALLLWGLGLVVGGLLSRTVARREDRFLLRNELGVGLFLGLVRLRGVPDR
jgi:hypothetical protein